MTDRIPMLVDRINGIEAKVDDLRDLIHEKHAETVDQLTSLWRNGPLTRIEARLTILESALESDTCKLDEHVVNCPVRADFEKYNRFRSRWWPFTLVGFGVCLAMLLVIGFDHPEVLRALETILPW